MHGSLLEHTPDSTFKTDVPDYPAIYEKGRRTFKLLFSRWMDTNCWSHPVMTELASCAMGGVRWLHSSQISGLRHLKTENPGPRTFVAIERLNYYVYRYSTEKRLIPGTDSSRLYSQAFAITEDGQPPSAGWFYEVFCGLRVPQDIDLRQAFFTDAQAEDISSNWGALIRKLIRDQDLDLITDLDRILRGSYPVKEPERLTNTRGVIQNTYVWSPDELIAELPAVLALTSALGGPRTEDELLHLLQEKRS